MVRSCSAYNCTNTHKVGTSFHSFPLHNKELLSQWLLAVKRDGFTPTKHSLICSEHFSTNSYVPSVTNYRQLKDGAVPTIFSFPKHVLRKPYRKRNPKTQASLAKNRQGERSKSLPRKRKKVPTVTTEPADRTYAELVRTAVEPAETEVVEPIADELTPCVDHDYTPREEFEVNSVIKDEPLSPSTSPTCLKRSRVTCPAKRNLPADHSEYINETPEIITDESLPVERILTSLKMDLDEWSPSEPSLSPNTNLEESDPLQLPTFEPEIRLDDYISSESLLAVTKAITNKRVKLVSIKRIYPPSTKTTSAGSAVVSESPTEVSTENRVCSNDHSGYAAPVRSENLCIESTLKTIALDLLNHNLNVRYYNDMIEVTYLRGHLVERSCVIDNQLRVRLRILDRPISNHHPIWRKYPNHWQPGFDYIAFLKDFFEVWKVCESCVEPEVVAVVQAGMKNAVYDHVTRSARSTECRILANREVCFNCYDMMRSAKKIVQRSKPKPVEPSKGAAQGANFGATAIYGTAHDAPYGASKHITSMNLEAARHYLQESRMMVQLEKRKVNRLQAKVQNHVENALKYAPFAEFVHDLEVNGSDLTKIFFDEQVNVANVQHQSKYKWHPKLMDWCLQLRKKSLSNYKMLREVIVLPSVKQLRKFEEKENGLQSEWNGRGEGKGLEEAGRV